EPVDALVQARRPAAPRTVRRTLCRPLPRRRVDARRTKQTDRTRRGLSRPSLSNDPPSRVRVYLPAHLFRGGLSMFVRARVLSATLAHAAAGFVDSIVQAPVAAAQAAAAPPGTLSEISTYVASAGKLVDLRSLFRDHTVPIYARHGIE